MKKATNYSLLVYALFLLCIYLIGSFVLSKGAGTIGGNAFAFYLIAIIIGFIITVIFMELGHIVGAKIGGYRIISVSFLWLTFVRQNKKWKITTTTFDGFTGETKVAPKKENANPMPMFWFGTIFLLILVLLGIYLPSVIPAKDSLKTHFVYGGYIISTIAGLMVFYNILPLRLDTKNDAIMMRFVRKERIQKYNDICRIQGELYDGEGLEELEDLPENDYLLAHWNYYAYLEKVYNGEYQKAEEILDRMIQDSEKLPDAIYDELLAAILVLLLLTKSKEEAQEYFLSVSPQVRKTINLCSTVEGSRNYFFISAIMNDNFEEAKSAYKKYLTKEKQNLEVGRNFDEDSMMAMMMNQIHEIHPEWNFKK